MDIIRLPNGRPPARRTIRPALRAKLTILLIGAACVTVGLAGPGAAAASAAPKAAAGTAATSTAAAGTAATSTAATSTAATSTAAAGTVALTFDDGPHATYTPQMLDALAVHGVKATFCLVGTQAQRYPALVRRIVAEGHRLCNHSMRHDDLATWTAAQVRADLTATNAVIRAAAPAAPIRYFRAPYGSWGQSAAVAAQLGMARLGWTVDPRDWSRPGVDVIIAAVLAQLRPGGIVLMHDAGGDRSQTVQAVRLLIPLLRDQGWRFAFPPVLAA